MRQHFGFTMPQCCLVRSVRQSAGQPTGRGGRCHLPDDQYTKTGRPVPEVLREKHMDMCVPPVENPVCAVFENYGEVPETLPLEFTEYDVMWVASKLSSAAGALGAKVIELRNWLLCFGCVSEELRVIVVRLADWMANSSSPWVSYCTLMPCRL